MRWPRVTLLVALYLALDFANPMMPGAVQLVEGSLETVDGCRARSGETPVLAVTVIPSQLLPAVPRREPALRARWRIVSAAPPVPVFFRAALEPQSTSASSPDDD